jgi:hypothetical protein
MARRYLHLTQKSILDWYFWSSRKAVDCGHRKTLKANYQSSVERQDDEAPSPPPKTDAKSEAKPAQPPTRPTAQPRVRTRQYLSSTHSTFNGRDYVEEHRERVTGANSETRIATRCRLGDRWDENEVHIDKTGKRVERETWHNVGDEAIEALKLKWSEKHPPSKVNTESKPAPTAIASPSEAAASPQ